MIVVVVVVVAFAWNILRAFFVAENRFNYRSRVRTPFEQKSLFKKVEPHISVVSDLK